jgi:hypothetical protein
VSRKAETRPWQSGRASRAHRHKDLRGQTGKEGRIGHRSVSSFRDRPIQPLSHLSERSFVTPGAGWLQVEPSHQREESQVAAERIEARQSPWCSSSARASTAKASSISPSAPSSRASETPLVPEIKAGHSRHRHVATRALFGRALPRVHERRTARISCTAANSVSRSGSLPDDNELLRLASGPHEKDAR